MNRIPVSPLTQWCHGVQEYTWTSLLQGETWSTGGQLKQDFHMVLSYSLNCTVQRCCVTQEKSFAPLYYLLKGSLTHATSTFNALNSWKRVEIKIKNSSSAYMSYKRKETAACCTDKRQVNLTFSSERNITVCFLSFRMWTYLFCLPGGPLAQLHLLSLLDGICGQHNCQV